MRRIYLELLILAAFLCFVPAAMAQEGVRRSIDPSERRELRADRREIRSDTSEIRLDRRDLRGDVRDRQGDIREFPPGQAKRSVSGRVEGGSAGDQSRYTRDSQ